MKLAHLFSLAAFSAAVSTSAFALNNADVIKMKKADLSEQTILLSIANEPANYDTSVDGLIALKEAGLSEAVIQRIVAVQKGGPAAGEASGGTPASDFAAQEFPSIAPPLVDPVAGREYFLRSTIHVEGDEFPATNYARGALVPINTPVRLESMTRKAINLKRIDTGDLIEVQNVEKYTRKTTAELARLMLSAEKTPLEQLPADLVRFISNGEMRKGMTKEQVLMARGYPPAHETASTDMDRWVYWSSRFVKQTIVFTNGRLTEGRGIY